MSKVRLSATFTLPDGSTFTVTRSSREAYSYDWAWLLLAGAGDRFEQGSIIAKGFSRTRENAESAARTGLKFGHGRIALYAPVTKGGAS